MARMQRPHLCSVQCALWQPWQPFPQIPRNAPSSQQVTCVIMQRAARVLPQSKSSYVTPPQVTFLEGLMPKDRSKASPAKCVAAAEVKNKEEFFEGLGNIAEAPRYFAPHASRLKPHASRLTPHASRLTPHASRLMPHASRLTPHASRLTPHASRLTPHASRLTPHASRFTPHAERRRSVSRCTSPPSTSHPFPPLAAMESAASFRQRQTLCKCYHPFPAHNPKPLTKCRTS